MSTIRVGAVGVLIRLTVQEGGAAKNLSTATTKEIHIYKPSGAEVERAATFTTNGADGQVQVVTQAGDLNEVGKYSAVVHLAMGSWSDCSSPYEFVVRPTGK